MRILHVADFVSPLLGYQELLLAKWNARNGHEVHILTSNRNPPAPDYKASYEALLGPRELPEGVSVHDGVTIHRVPIVAEWRTRILMRHVRQVCEAINPDVILNHGTMSPTALSVAQIASRSHTPLFMDNHMVFSVMDNSLLGRATYIGAKFFMRTFLAPRVEKFYGVAQECSDFLIEAQGAPAGKVGLLPLGVDTELFSFDLPSRMRVRDAWGVPDEAIVIGQTGKLDPSKDPLTLARAAVSTMRQNPDVFLIFVGGGPTTYLSEMIRVLEVGGVTERTRILPPVAVQDLAAVFSACDVLVFPGGASMSSLEAAACNRVVVMNDLPASKWRSEAGVGFTFPVGDHAVLSGLLSSLCGDAAARERLGVEAGQAVLSKYSYRSIASQLERDMALSIAATDRVHGDGRSGRSRRGVN